MALTTLLVPPVPVQLNEYAVLAVRAPVLSLPLVAFAPLQPPVAVHPVAFVELHVSVEVPPIVTTEGLATNVAVGLPVTVTVAVTTLLVPPTPVQANE